MGLFGVEYFLASSIVASCVSKGLDSDKVSCSRCGQPLFADDVKLVALERPVTRWVHISCLPLGVELNGEITPLHSVVQ